MKPTTLRLGIIGLGAVAHYAHGPAIKRSAAGIELVAGCDVEPAAVQKWQATYGGAGYTSIASMVEHQKLDAVILATWPNQHRDQIEQILGAGIKNILCEKALALTGGEAAEIYDLAQRAGAFVMEGFMYRHNPVIRRLEEILARGEVGAVDNVRACFSAFDEETVDPANPNRNWRQRPERGGGIPYDFACYCVNACGHFAGGRPVRAHALGGVGPYGTINRLYGTMEYDNGVVGIIESSKQSSFTQELQISCAHGILNVPIAWTIPGNLTITQRHTGWNALTYDTHATEGVADDVTSHVLQLENFAAVARGKARPVIALAESVVNTFALEALVTSVREQRIVEIKLPGHLYETARVSR